MHGRRFRHPVARLGAARVSVAETARRSRTMEKLYGLVIAAMATRPTRDWHSRLDAAEVPNEPVNTLRQDPGRPLRRRNKPLRPRRATD